MRKSTTSKRRETISGLYLCQFSQGTIKIGMGKDVEARLASHRAAGIVFGITVVRTDVVLCENMEKAERLLIEWCEQNSTACNGREWFDGLDYEACLVAAKTAAMAMMGPHPEKPVKCDPIRMLMDNFGTSRTKEADLYSEVRELMLRRDVPREVVRALDFLHRESERVRATMRMGGPMPEWYDLLNCFEFWEVELWFDGGKPSQELLQAGAEALGSIAQQQEAQEGSYV